MKVGLSASPPYSLHRFLYLSTCAANLISTWIVSTVCCPQSIHHLTRISPWFTDTTSPQRIRVEKTSFFSLLFPPLLRLLLSPELVLVTHLSARHQASLLSDRQVLPMSDGVICYKCTKHGWSENCHPRVLENTGEPRTEGRGPSPFITSTDRLSQFSFSFFLYYVPQLINAPQIIYGLIYSPLRGNAYHLEKTTCAIESVAPIIR